MGRRQQFQAVLEALSTDLKVYFQEPDASNMLYPCIVYHRDTGSTQFSNNRPYNYEQQYEVKLIAREPDTTLFDKLAALPKSTHDRFYVADNLNHDVFSIYF